MCRLRQPDAGSSRRGPHGAPLSGGEGAADPARQPTHRTFRAGSSRALLCPCINIQPAALAQGPVVPFTGQALRGPGAGRAQDTAAGVSCASTLAGPILRPGLRVRAPTLRLLTSSWKRRALRLAPPSFRVVHASYCAALSGRGHAACSSHGWPCHKVRSCRQRPDASDSDRPLTRAVGPTVWTSLSHGRAATCKPSYPQTPLSSLRSAPGRPARLKGRLAVG